MSPTSPADNTRPPGNTTTHDRILAYLQENRVASVQGLSRAWGLTKADIRYHFNALIEEGLVELLPRDPAQPAKRGRPAQQYRLASSAVPDNFPTLCSMLLDALLCPLPITEREPAIRALANRLAGDFVSIPGLTQRFTQASAFLSQHGYRARWEAYASGPRILLRNCPYAAILPTHPELCTLDRYLLEHLVQVPLQQTARMNLSGGRPAACIFASE